MNEVAGVVVRWNRTATAVLAALLIHGRKGRAGIAPDFEWLAGMLSYVEEIATREHYRYEEAWLLKPLEKQMPELRPKFARMRRDRIGAGGYCVRTAEALANWKRGWPKGIDQFFDNARDHFRLSADHGLVLRRSILPAAEQCFTAAQWQSAAAALARAPDPVAQCRGRAECEAALCRRMGRAGPPKGTVGIDPDQGNGAGAKSSLVPLFEEVR